MAMDIERTLASMIAARLDLSAGQFLHYTQDPPGIDTARPLYAIVQLRESEVGYVIGGFTTGRRLAQWELTLIGLRDRVVDAANRLPSLLTGYYNGAEEDGALTCAGSMLVSVQPATRQQVPAGAAATIMRWQTEIL